MPKCPLCGSSHIILTFRPRRRGYCFRCDLVWGLDGSTIGEGSQGGPAPLTGTPGENQRVEHRVPERLRVMTAGGSPSCHNGGVSGGTRDGRWFGSRAPRVAITGGDDEDDDEMEGLHR